MTAHQYLESVLEANKFDDESTGQTVAERRAEVEEKLRKEFGSKIQTIKYSGSIAKATAVKDSYDVDIAVHFKHDAFDKLKEMFDAVYDFLKKHYTVRKQRVSVGIKSLHVDVVPGRRINADDPQDNDVNLYRTDTDSRIKTNIVKQIDAVSASSVRDVIKLTKIWRDVWGLSFKSFALELLVMKALDGFDGSGLDNKMKTVLTFIQENVENVILSDPGNPSNNVADTIDSGDKEYFKKTATKCLGFLEDAEQDEDPDMENAWRKVFKDQTVNESGSSAGSRIIVMTQDKRVHVDRTHG
ncbi:hypothetical protein SY88_00395 [Clostridiales bacterium PH28_bin88]|nr:hypothetical protein SY88_00395 [Clostridiales bacterium PH28_bin88]